MRILSVDIGIVNFGMVEYCTLKRRFIGFHLIKVKGSKDLVKEMKRLSESEPFQLADVILIENQMRQCMKTMAVSLRCFNFDKTVCVAPQCIKRYFKTSKKSHLKNKKAAVEESEKHMDPIFLSKFKKLKKKDDIADCVLQTIWFVNVKLPLVKST
jgi:hypothetical protein